jgi:flagellar hook-length control protein FliK
LQPDTFLNFFSAVKTNTGSTDTVTGLMLAPNSAGLTGSDADTGAGTFDLTKDSQDGNAFSASARNVMVDANSLPSGLESSSTSSPYSFASQLVATKATSLGATGLPPAVEQVMLQLNRNVKSGNDQMTLQLNPAELGRVSIKLDIGSDGKVQGTVVANNPATLDLLLKDVRSLERALQDAGLRADPGSLQFSLGGQSGGSSGQTANSSSQTSGNSTATNLALDPALVTADQTETYYLTPGRVNLRV